ncbi:ABC transporter domain-containing protein [Eremomyces bilateralis CBS 781.70]|uniref:ABC transporter domain-containing protein n=1 Tax=Eremomyces bilateralis CBS 781.70 TaxID=1392243 RepID=A0A6G1GGA4_9PEZI|nr:ABC transporter domain-containing protein [Eremomyces bilateralis CBS 781.70]KAF1817135.1 ABC transporter domain-containing protein [Eremomyces bilateralis CBS 781.70]
MRYSPISRSRRTNRWHIKCLIRSVHNHSSPLVDIKNGTFYRSYPASVHPTAGDQVESNIDPTLFSGLNYSIPSFPPERQNWCVLSTSSAARTAFLHVLQGQYVCLPPTARTFPYLSSPEVTAKDSRLRSPSIAIQYVGFDASERNVGHSSLRGAYLSARYEARREVTDFSVRNFLTGDTELNPDETLLAESRPPQELLEDIAERLRLKPLLEMPLSNLSNGQMRRTRVGKALMGRPELLLLDGPFMGLDPRTVVKLSSVLQNLADHRNPRLVLSLRPDDLIPDWVSHVMFVGDDFRVISQGPKEEVFEYIRVQHEAIGRLHPTGVDPKWSQVWEQPSKDPKYDPIPKTSIDGFTLEDTTLAPIGKPLVEMKGVKIKYGDQSTAVLGNWTKKVGGKEREGLWWTVRQGERWGLFGPNGSGKTTVISLITSDHPQTYSAPVQLFGRSRLPSPGQPGISVFDIQSRVGHSSPEVHAFFPRHLSVRRTIESAWADAPLAKPKLSYDRDKRVSSVLRWFQAELNPALEPPAWQQSSDADVGWADEMRFGALSFSAQRVALFLRAIIGRPDLVVLDEAFSGMDEWARGRCLLFLAHGERKIHRRVNRERMMSARAGVDESDLARLGRVTVEGLGAEQGLIVVSHRKEEVPGCVREWMCLREVGEGPPRVGRLKGPLEMGPKKWWDEIWGV